jgi:hypothetical protein
MNSFFDKDAIKGYLFVLVLFSSVGGCFYYDYHSSRSRSEKKGKLEKELKRQKSLDEKEKKNNLKTFQDSIIKNVKAYLYKEDYSYVIQKEATKFDNKVLINSRYLRINDIVANNDTFFAYISDYGNLMILRISESQIPKLKKYLDSEDKEFDEFFTLLKLEKIGAMK